MAANTHLKKLTTYLHKNNSDKDLFEYLDKCISKYEDKKKDNARISEVNKEQSKTILHILLSHLKITEPQLMNNRDYCNHKALLYYYTKKKLKISYEAVGDLFGKHKSYVYYSASRAEIIVKKSKKHPLQDIMLHIDQQYAIAANTR